MSQMKHQVRIHAAPETVYQALTTEEGLRGWWAGDSVADARVGAAAEFRYGEDGPLLRMRIAELVPGSRVVWECLGEDKEWRGTRVVWQMKTAGGATDLTLNHTDWISNEGSFGTCNAIWGCSLYRLKDFAEGRKPGPFFPARKEAAY